MTEQTPSWHTDSLSSTAEASLSPAGVSRRERMLDDLQGDMRRLHRMRRVRRNVAGAAAIIALAFAGASMLLREPGSSTLPGPSTTPFAYNAPSPSNAIPPAAAVITIVQTPAQPMDAIIVRTRDAGALRMSDSELLETLVAMNRPTGLVRSGHRAWLTRNVADL